ncbi:MAG: hypothetical protein O2U61_06440 [Candidatus Bathyarchaeota archaeon]|nr:hypothetical protein [Candidatus Bathyarchaeota archaeon]MCZ2846113.1 hypothetical protein [Candidatus Bathyarchaeota archaeon]
MKKRQVDGFNIKAGPTVSGIETNPVGGEIIPINKLSLLLAQHWLLIILLLIPFALLFYAKRGLAMKLFSPIITRLLRPKWI